MSQFIKFYFTSSMLNMLRILIHLSSGACDFSVVTPHWLRVLISTCVGVSVWVVGVVSVWQAEVSACYTDTTPTSHTSWSISLPHRYHPNQPHQLKFQPATRIPPQPATAAEVSACHTDTTPTSRTETPTHVEIRTRNQCGVTTEKSQIPDDGCINIRSMLSIEEVK